MPLEQLALYKKAKREGDELAAEVALARFDRNKDFLGFGYLNSPEEAVPPVSIVAEVGRQPWAIQNLLGKLGKTPVEKPLIINSLGRKWELTFTTLVLFGGALFAAFPKFYVTSFGGAYWVWILILFTFVIQAVSYEFRKKPGNFLSERVYEIFLFVNGSVGILLIGAAVGTFFTGSSFTLNEYNFVSWTNPLRGLEAAFSLFNLSLGLFLVFNARILGAMYLVNNIDFTGHGDMEARMRKAAFINLLCALPFLLYVGEW